MKIFNSVRLVVMHAVGVLSTPMVEAAMPAEYAGKAFQDASHTNGAQVIPGRIECACYDLGGEGVAYHDTDAVNHGSGELNFKPEHHRPHTTPYIWGFRGNEGVD